MALWESFTNQKQWKEYIQRLLKINDKALLKAVVLIYENQTDEEKSENESVEDNNVGFNKIDASVMCKIARKIKRGEELAEKDVSIARYRMPKYWRQLMVISKEKMRVKAYLNKEHEEMLRRCSEEGIMCSYGICDECPNNIQEY